MGNLWIFTILYEKESDNQRLSRRCIPTDSIESPWNNKMQVKEDTITKIPQTKKLKSSQSLKRGRMGWNRKNEGKQKP